MLPPTLTTLTLFPLFALTLSSPSPPTLQNDSYTLLVPRNTLFFRQTKNLQTFTSALGGFQASAIENSGDAKRPFKVDGDTFVDFDTAAQRSCDNQFQGCSKKANEGGNKGSLTVKGCDDQKGQCTNAQKSATVKDFKSGGQASTNIGPDPQFPDFDLICDA